MDIQKITAEFANARAMERATIGTDEQHRMFVMIHDHNTATGIRFDEVACAGEADDIIQRTMVRVMLGNIRDMSNIVGIVMEAHATCRNASEYTKEGKTIDQLTQEQIDALPTIDTVVTGAFDGIDLAFSVRRIDGSTEEPHADADGAAAVSVGGRLADTLTTLGLGTLLAAKFAREQENND